MTAKDEHSDVPRWRGLGGGLIKTNVKGNMYNNNHYNKRNQRFANELRQNMTKSGALKNAGYEIVRYTDKQVLTDITNVISEIERIIECLEKGDLMKRDS